MLTVSKLPLDVILPAVKLPVALTSPPVLTLPNVPVPAALTMPPVRTLPPVTLPVALKLVPVAAPMFGVVSTALAGMINWLLPLMPIVALAEPSVLTLNCVPFNDSALPAVYCPAPENCAHIISVAPTVIGLALLLVHTQPVSASTLPVSTNVNAPYISAGMSKSTARVNTYAVPGAPAVVTT